MKQPPIDPVAAVRSYREKHVNVRRLLMQDPDAQAGVTLKTPNEQPIHKLDLPAALRDAMAAYQKAHTEVKSLTMVKYMKTVNGNPELVVEDDDPLPAEENLVTFSHTVSAVSIKSVTIVTHQLVATLAAAKG
jgi:hypothetical protein